MGELPRGTEQLKENYRKSKEIIKFYKTMSVPTCFCGSGTYTLLPADNQRLRMDEIRLIRPQT
jgi:hypothetical protein